MVTGVEARAEWPAQTYSKVVIAGQGFVGLPLAVHAAESGHWVVGYDVDARRVESLRAGTSYVADVSDERLRSIMESGRYHPTNRDEACEDFDVAVICVPTPSLGTEPDLSLVLNCAKTVGAYVRPGCCVILESSTFPGTTEDDLVPTLEDASGLTAGVDFSVGYSPERIDPGNRQWGITSTPRVVSGVGEGSIDAVAGFYGSFVDTVVRVSSPRVAEFSKLYENVFRYVNIAFVNEMATLGHHLDLDFREALDACASKPFGYLGFRPGPGVGGHCLPMNATYLSWWLDRSLDRGSTLLERAIAVNTAMPHYVVERIARYLATRSLTIDTARVLLLGLAYKADVADFRDAPALEVLDHLLDLGATVDFAEPTEHVMPFEPSTAQRVNLTPETIAAADVVVLLVDHADFDLELVTHHAHHVLDTLGRMSGDRVESL